jgi:hypothetical protein
VRVKSSVVAASGRSCLAQYVSITKRLSTPLSCTYLNLFDEFGERCNARLKALGIQDKRSFVLVESALHIDIAFVNSIDNCVPSYVVLRLSREQSPHWRIESGVTRFWNIMEVGGAWVARRHPAAGTSDRLAMLNTQLNVLYPIERPSGQTINETSSWRH